MASRLALAIHGLFLSACKLLWRDRKAKNDIKKLENELLQLVASGSNAQAAAAEVFMVADMSKT